MLGDLFRSGFDIVEDHEDADAIVVNTCSFVEEAKTESLEVRHFHTAPQHCNHKLDAECNCLTASSANVRGDL